MAEIWYNVGMKNCLLLLALAGSSMLPASVAELTGDGVIHLRDAGITMGVRIHVEGWKGSVTPRAQTSARFPDARSGRAKWRGLSWGKDPSPLAHGVVDFTSGTNGVAEVHAVAVSDADQRPEAVVWTLDLPADRFAGGSWSVDGGRKKGVLPAAFDGRHTGLYNARCSRIELTDRDGRATVFAFPEPTPVLVQDGRKWGPTFTVRLFNGKVPFGTGAKKEMSFTVAASDGVEVKYAEPTVVRAGPGWIPVDYRKNIVPGSALDFSNQGLQDAPAGKHGWLRNVGGHFEFEDRPGVPQRFYGVNLCFGANVPGHDVADELVARLVRLGYNTVRVHHYERDLLKDPRKNHLVFDEARLDRFDYLMAKAIAAGLYVTTDLFVSRPVRWEDIGLGDAEHRGLIGEKALYKCLVALHDPAFDDWCAFARKFLEHRNPYTGRRYLDEPALPLISLINEGQLTMGWGRGAKEHPVVRAAYAKWLAGRRAADPGFCPDAPADAAQLSVYGAGKGSSAMALFMADTERRSAARMIAFLKSIGCRALFTNANCGPHFTPMQAVRGELYDYVDDHFYVDHPHFLEQRWALPSRIGNANPVLMDSLPLVGPAWTRMPHKPMCVTEWNFSGPGQYRGVGGIMTGALSALQDWDGMWRFAYSHSDKDLVDGPFAPGYFNVGTDPLGQASDRASVCLFLRRDLAPLTQGTAFLATEADLHLHDGDRAQAARPKHWGDAFAWQRRVATASSAAQVPAGMETLRMCDTYGSTNGPSAAAAVPGFALDRARGTFRIDTPRTSGGFAPSGALDCGALSFATDGSPATVWASSVDAGKTALREASRILVTHLTDVQGDGTTYADGTKTVLLKWGKAPPVARAGRAEVRLDHASPGRLKVWALDTTGARVAEVPARVEDGRLVFTAAVEAPTARFHYEVALH